MRAACLSLSAPSPARRPLRLALSDLSPPSLCSATHLFTARRLALNKFAASTCLIPSRTAFTTCRRSMCCAAGLSFLASSRLFMQTLTHHALFGARISNSRCTELVHGWVFYDRHSMDLPGNVARIGILNPGHVVLVFHDDGTGTEFRF